MTRAFLNIIAVLLILLTLGCTSSLTNNKRLNIGPVLSYDEETDKESTELDAVGPFFSFHSKPMEKEYGLRPFFYVTKKDGGAFTQVEFLFPLGKYKRTDLERDLFFVPFFASHKDYSIDEGKSSSFSLFPVFWGTDEEGNDYGGFFPFYGRLHSRFGRDRLRFILWPLYSDYQYEDATTRNILWPVLSYTSGNSKSGFRIWPFYGHEEKRGIYSKSFAFWPIVTFQKTDLDTDNPKKLMSILPFYTVSRSANAESKTILSPFFNYSYDKHYNYRKWDLPWPIIQYAKGDRRRTLKIFPFYGSESKPQTKKKYFLWPLYSMSRITSENHKETTHRVLFLNKFQKTKWKKISRKEESTRIWPVFYYNKGIDGSKKYSFPEILPMHHESFERNLAPLFRLYTYKKDSKGDRETKLLWGLFTHKKRDSKEFFDISFLFSYEKEDATKQFSLLKGLFEYKKKKDTSSIKLLYLPRRIQW